MIDLIQEIYGTIKRNKLRTFLTGFAVAWGIFMLIVLLGAGNGLINAFESNAGGRALNSMKVYPGWTNKPFDGLKEGRSIKLTEKDMEITGNFKDNVTAVGATIEQSSVNLSYGEDHVSLLLEGVTPEYLHIDAISIKTGRFINAPDIKEKRKVILLHEKTVEMLFGKKDANVIGKYVNASGLAYQVIGVYTDMGNYSPSAYIPFTTLQLIYNKGDKLETLVFLTQNLPTEKANEDFEKQYRQAIGNHQRFDPTDRGAIWISNRFTQYLQQQKGNNILHTAIWESPSCRRHSG